MENFNLKVIISCHYLVYGAPQALRDFLISRNVKSLLYITSPLFITKNDREIKVIHYLKSQNKIEINKKISNINIIKYLQDIFYGCYFGFSKSDIYIGVDPINGLIGVILKKLGRTKYFIYYTIDYVPIRTKSKILNRIYHYVDKISLKNSDETWNVSPRISQGREDHNRLLKNIYSQQFVVPIGVWLNENNRLSEEIIEANSLIFIGNLHPKQGVQLVLKAMKTILERIPDFKFTIVGGGDYQKHLIDLARELNVEKNVTFTGWVKDRQTLEGLMKNKALAIAMYDSREDDFTYYADPTKLKDYLSYGLPILLTKLPHNAYEIEENGCGIVIDYNEAEISNSIIKILKDSELQLKYRNNAFNYVAQYDWNKIFNVALSRYLNAKL